MALRLFKSLSAFALAGLFSTLSLAQGGGDIGSGLKPPKPAAQNLADKSPRCEPAKVNECRSGCDRKKFDTSVKDEIAKKQYECKQDCIRGC